VKKIVVIALIAAFGVLVLLRERSTKNAIAEKKAAQTVTASAPASAPVAAAATKTASESASASKTDSAPALLSQENRVRLNEIARLDRKAFMSESEKAFRLTALKDDQFLKDVASILGSRELDPATRKDQYQAIDLLLAAQGSGSQAANQYLKNVVQDPQVENEALAKDVRENLAGIKAEVMYKWRGQEGLESLLPGPASRQIWANVRDQQSRNEAESKTLSH